MGNEGALGDYYQYGAGNPQGRGGGADNKAIDSTEMRCPPGTKAVGNQCLKHDPYSMG